MFMLVPEAVPMFQHSQGKECWSLLGFDVIQRFQNKPIFSHTLVTQKLHSFSENH